jgi:hypothetical protein
MNTTTDSPSSTADPVPASADTGTSRCPYLYPNGKRCSLPGSPSHSGFCSRHSQTIAPAAQLVPVQNDSEDLSSELLPELSEFSSGVDIRTFLARLLILITKGRVSPRRASVMAYVTNQLLYSHRAIARDNLPQPKQSGPYLDFSDWPNVVRGVWPDGGPVPHPSQSDRNLSPAVIRGAVATRESRSLASQQDGSRIMETNIPLDRPNR